MLCVSLLQEMTKKLTSKVRAQGQEIEYLRERSTTPVSSSSEYTSPQFGREYHQLTVGPSPYSAPKDKYRRDEEEEDFEEPVS